VFRGEGQLPDTDFFHGGYISHIHNPEIEIVGNIQAADLVIAAGGLGAYGVVGVNVFG